MTFEDTVQRFKLHHILFWLVFFAVWYYFRFQDFSTREKALIITSIKVADLAIMVYITNYILVPRLIYKKHYGWFAAIFITLIFLGSTFKLHIIGNILSPGNFYVFDNFKTRVYDNVIPHLLLVCTGAAFKLLLDYAKAQKQIAAITIEKSEAELNFLKSQINPHFVFNSLNSIYFLIDKENQDARNALQKFSDMLRYQLYELNGQEIEIEKEINFLNNYIELQKLRKNTNCLIEFNCGTGLNNFRIEPLMLIPFVENAFKHVSTYNNGKANAIHIDLTKRNGEMEFKVSNTTEEDSHITDLTKIGGIGLYNVKRRLELLYPARHQLHINKDDNSFNVELKIKV